MAANIKKDKDLWTVNYGEFILVLFDSHLNRRTSRNQFFSEGIFLVLLSIDILIDELDGSWNWGLSSHWVRIWSFQISLEGIYFCGNSSHSPLEDVIVGKIYFLLVRIKIKYMEIALIRRESTGLSRLFPLFSLLYSFVVQDHLLMFIMRVRRSPNSKSWMVLQFVASPFLFACF